jgi:hypothetical protein
LLRYENPQSPRSRGVLSCDLLVSAWLPYLADVGRNSWVRVVAIISASAPTLRPLLRIMPLSFNSHLDTYGTGNLGTVGSGRADDNHNSRSRTKSSGQFELMSFRARNPIAKLKPYIGGGRRSNTSEESILKDKVSRR